MAKSPLATVIPVAEGDLGIHNLKSEYQTTTNQQSNKGFAGKSI